MENKPWKMPERCIAARCSNVADPEKHISMHKIPFLGEKCPIMQKKTKKVDRLRVGEKKDVGAGEDVLVVLKALYCGRF